MDRSVERKIKYLSGWFGNNDETEFLHQKSHPSSGLADYILATVDKLNALPIKENIEVHFNVQPSFSNLTKYLFLLEHPFIRPQNIFLNSDRYKKIFSWDLRLKNLPNFVYTPYPHDFRLSRYNDERQYTFSMISSNRNLVLKCDRKSIYNKRQDVIRYCEENKKDFHLFGAGWDRKFVSGGIVQYSLSKFSTTRRLLRKNSLNCYRGTVSSKSSVLESSVFNFCYENIMDYPGYVSEKVWDSLAAGAIPVYWPSWSVPDEYLPSDSYVDASKFHDVNSLFNYLESMSVSELRDRQGYCFDIAKKMTRVRSINKYVESVVSVIRNDLI